jgi:predicted nuclease of predicted toxin-antitoxin system
MKLLFDQNISYRITRLLNSSFPDCKHVKDVGLNEKSDTEIWEFAKMHNFVIVTFDADFYDLAVIKGIPPKTIWLRMGILIH